LGEGNTFLGDFMTKIWIKDCFLATTRQSMLENGFAMTGPMSWVTGGGTALSYSDDGTLMIEGSLPSGLQSFCDAGGALPKEIWFQISQNSLETQVYREFLEGMANLPPHPDSTWGDKWEAAHNLHHAAKEAVYAAWDAARDAVHGSREADS
jgi:hypothetical protein